MRIQNPIFYNCSYHMVKDIHGITQIIYHIFIQSKFTKYFAIINYVHVYEII